MEQRPERLLHALAQVWARGEWEVAALERVQGVLAIQETNATVTEQGQALHDAITRRRERARQKMRELIDAYQPETEEA